MRNCKHCNYSLETACPFDITGKCKGEEHHNISSYKIYLILLRYLTERNDDKAQMMVSMLGELHKRVDKVESEG